MTDGHGVIRDLLEARIAAINAQREDLRGYYPAACVVLLRELVRREQLDRKPVAHVVVTAPRTFTLPSDVPPGEYLLVPAGVEPCRYPDCACPNRASDGLRDCAGAKRALGVSFDPLSEDERKKVYRLTWMVMHAEVKRSEAHLVREIAKLLAARGGPPPVVPGDNRIAEAEYASWMTNTSGVQPSCEWTESDPWGPEPSTYDSACGEKWSFTEGGAKENGVKFCHNCGKPVKVIPFIVPADEEDDAGVSESDSHTNSRKTP